MATTLSVTLTIEVDVKDEDALRLASAVDSQMTEGSEERTLWIPDGDLGQQFQIFAGMEVTKHLVERDDLFTAVRVHASS